jgi:hypothetical protein
VDGIVKGKKGKLVRPLREEWILRDDGREEGVGKDEVS